ncbi:MAG TPA: hypothetical protein ENI87_12425 [bacterium]|nr:hypothetical protein [bacterium]
MLLLLLACLAGCLEIDGQDVYFRYDQDNDRIDALLVYRGMFAEGGTATSSPPMQKAIEDLASARKTGEFVFWNNWPLSCNPCRDYDPVRNALLKHVEVENGGLFTDPKGTLCGYQFVRINRARSFVKKLNTLLTVALQAGLAKGLERLGGHRLDDDTADLVREFLRSREPLLVVEQNRIELRLPLSARDHRWFKGYIEGHLMDNLPGEITRRLAVEQRRALGGSPTDTSRADEAVSIEGTSLKSELERAPSFRFFWDNDLSIHRTSELTTLGIGVVGSDELHVKKAPGGLYHDALLQELRTQGERIEDGLPDQELFRRFEQFRGREPRLPEELAARRG